MRAKVLFLLTIGLILNPVSAAICPKLVAEIEARVAKHEFPWTTARPLYFGCLGSQCGHHPSGDGQRILKRTDLAGAWLSNQDGRVPPVGRPPAGTATLHHLPAASGHEVEGYTLLGFWDNSVDTRPGSHSTFLLPGKLSFEEAVEMATQAFPGVWERFKFKVILSGV